MIVNNIPTSKSDIMPSIKICRLVFSTPRYLLFFLFLVPIFPIFLIIPTDYIVLKDIVLFGNESLISRISLLYNILPLTGGSTYSVFTDSMMWILSVSVSANITLLLYHIAEHGFEIGDTAGSTTSTVLSVIGAGCASCGSTILTGLFSIFGISGALTVLPLKGGEFLIIGFFVSVLSIYWISEGLRGGKVRGCPIE